MKISTIPFLTITLSLLISCSNDHVRSDTYRFDHVKNFADKYSESLADSTLSETEIQFRLLDIRSREQDLRHKGDSVLADYFIISIEENLYNSDPDLAEKLFGKRFRSVFLL